MPSRQWRVRDPDRAARPASRDREALAASERGQQPGSKRFHHHRPPYESWLAEIVSGRHIFHVDGLAVLSPFLVHIYLYCTVTRLSRQRQHNKQRRLVSSIVPSPRLSTNTERRPFIFKWSCPCPRSLTPSLTTSSSSLSRPYNPKGNLISFINIDWTKERRREKKNKPSPTLAGPFFSFPLRCWIYSLMCVTLYSSFLLFNQIRLESKTFACLWEKSRRESNPQKISVWAFFLSYLGSLRSASSQRHRTARRKQLSSSQLDRFFFLSSFGVRVCFNPILYIYYSFFLLRYQEAKRIFSWVSCSMCGKLEFFPFLMTQRAIAQQKKRVVNKFTKGREKRWSNCLWEGKKKAKLKPSLVTARLCPSLQPCTLVSVNRARGLGLFPKQTFSTVRLSPLPFSVRY